WIHRDDYARAGLRMLPVTDPRGLVTGGSMVMYCVALLAVSVGAAALGWGGSGYLAGGLLLGGAVLAAAAAVWRKRTLPRARGVLRASLVYLPALLALWLLDVWLT